MLMLDQDQKNVRSVIMKTVVGLIVNWNYSTTSAVVLHLESVLSNVWRVLQRETFEEYLSVLFLFLLLFIFNVKMKLQEISMSKL